MQKKYEVSPTVQKDFKYIYSAINNFIASTEQKYSSEFNHQTLIKKSVNDSLVKILKSALLSKAKMIRPLFCFWIFRNFCRKQSENQKTLDEVTKIAITIEVLHNASLIIDDIEDGSDFRRDKPAIYKEFGLPLALNAASWMYFLSFEHLSSPLQAIVSKALVDCHVGQAIDLSGSNHNFSKCFFTVSSRERWDYYEKSVTLKTTRLILLSLELLKKALKLKTSEYNLTKTLICHYGIVYQIFDDLKNVFPELSGHKLNEDLKTGFRSAVSIQFLDLLSDEEYQIACNHFEEKRFFEYVISHEKFNAAVTACFKKATNLLIETTAYIDKHLNQSYEMREYLSFLFEHPFLEVKNIIEKHLFYKNYL